MRSWASTMLAAVMGGGVTAAVLIAAGLVDTGGDTRVVETPVAGKGAPMLASAVPKLQPVRSAWQWCAEWFPISWPSCTAWVNVSS